MRSLRRSLQLGLVGSLILSLGLLWWLSNGQIRTLSEALVVSRLAHDAESLLAAIQWRDGKASIGARGMSDIYLTPFSGHYYQVQHKGRVLLQSRSLWDTSLDGATLAVGEISQNHSIGPMKQPLLVYQAGFNKQGENFTLLVAEDLTSLHQLLSRFHLTFAATTLITLLLLLGVQTQVVRRTIATLERLRDQMRSLQQGELTHLDAQVPQEVTPLVEEINHLIELHSDRLQRSRNATGNLAHALKGPLNLLGQSLNDPHLKAQPKLQQELSEQLNRIRQLMERELKRARLAGGEIPGRKFDPGEELPNLVTLLERIYADRSITFHQQLTPTDMQLPLDREDMLELFGNLLDNAAKWANSRVTCEIQESTEGVRIRVSDDGPGCADEQLEHLTTRGSRIDESIAGHGLGLAIVADIVRLYGGQLAFGRASNLGGLEVLITLPLRVSPASQ